MSESKDFYILGYSGHAYVVIEAITSNPNQAVRGYFDKEEIAFNPYGLDYLGLESKDNLAKHRGFFFPALGSNTVRAKLFDLLTDWEVAQTNAVDQSAKVSSTLKIGSSNLIAPSVTINAQAVVGNACIINTGAIVEHGCSIGDFSHIAPGAVLAGDVTVGTHSFIGANAVIRQGQQIGNHVTIGAGSVVISDIEDHQTWAGNPAKRIG